MSHDDDRDRDQGTEPGSIDEMVGPPPEIREADDTERRTELMIQRPLNLMDEIQRLEQAKEIIVRRAELLTTIRNAGIGDTDPAHWVLHKAKDGTVVGIPSSAACARMAKLFGVEVMNMRPVDGDGNFNPAQIPVKDGTETEYRGFCDARSKVTGEFVEQIEFSRRTDEAFIGRYDDMSKRVGPWVGDIRKSVGTGLRSKSVRVLTGTGKVPYSDLAAQFKAAGKDPEQCVKGHGFDTSAARAAARVASPEVAASIDVLRTKILAHPLVSGDNNLARKMLKAITSKPKTDKSKGFGGFDDIKRLTQDWQVKNALDALTTVDPEDEGFLQGGE